MRDLRSLPKAHLHVHLETAVRWSTVRELADANGVTVPETLLSGRHRLGGFADFFAQNDLVRSCLCRPDDFRRAAYELCADQAADGVRYVEVSCTAAMHGERLSSSHPAEPPTCLRGDLAMPLTKVLAGLAAGWQAYGIEYGVILDHSRRRSVERARRAAPRRASTTRSTPGSVTRERARSRKHADSADGDSDLPHRVG